MTNLSKPAISLVLAAGLFFLQGQPRNAVHGDVAVGEEIGTSPTYEIINPTPCAAGTAPIRFNQPMRIIRKDTASCRDGGSMRQYVRVQVEQQ